MKPYRERFFSKRLRCFYIGLSLLIIQFVVAIILIYNLESNGTVPEHEFCLKGFLEELRTFTWTSLLIGFYFIMPRKDLIYRSMRDRQKTNLSSSGNDLCSAVVIALDQNTVAEKGKEILEKLIEEDFVPVIFYNIHPRQVVPELNRVETFIILRKKYTFLVVVFHSREDNTWWFGDISSDPSYKLKLGSLNLTIENLPFQKHEGVIERFETVHDEETNFLMPRDEIRYLLNMDNSQFIECNLTQAALFRGRFRPDKSAQAARFRHKVWKMLSRVKTVFENLGIVFWLSSGTVLGYFRECDIIAHSKDVDIGVWATSYSEKIISELQSHGFRLKISLGYPNDSLELSFLDQSGIKLDVFFFYQEKDYYWNGGTQVKSGKKFKYTFPKFTLCWTLFKDLRVRVPCKTEEYIRANYGPNWFIPVKSWDWKTSPSNVKPNGVWTLEQLSSAVKIYL